MEGVNNNPEEFPDGYQLPPDLLNLEFNFSERPKDFSNLLAEREPFDSTRLEVSEEEQAIAKQVFESTFDDSLLGNIERAYSSPDRGKNLPARTSLNMKYDWGDEKDYLSVGLTLEGSEKKITVQRISGQLGKEGSEYYIDSDGRLLRHDFDYNNDLQERLDARDKTMDPGDDEEPLISLIKVHDLKDRLERALENQKFEKDSGINDQPVSLEETERLLNLVRSNRLK